MRITFKRLLPGSTRPTRAHATDAGYDLYAVNNPDHHDSRPLMPHERRVIKTGIAIALPAGYYGRVAPRSGLAIKHGLTTLAGVVDAGYRGDVSVVLLNTSEDDPVWIKPGDRVGQLIIERCHDADFVEAGDGEDLEQSDRGAAGFGSSGV